MVSVHRGGPTWSRASSGPVYTNSTAERVYTLSSVTQYRRQSVENGDRFYSEYEDKVTESRCRDSSLVRAVGCVLWRGCSRTKQTRLLGTHDYTGW